MCSQATTPTPNTHTHTQVESVEQAQLRAPLNGKHSQKQFYLMTSRFSSINSACVAVSCLLWINEELEGIKLIKKRLQKALKRAECCAAGSDFPDTPWFLGLSVAPALSDTHGPEYTNSSQTKSSLPWVFQGVPF